MNSRSDSAFTELLDYSGPPAAREPGELAADLENDCLKGLWQIQGRAEVATRIRPHVWKWDMLRRYLERAGAQLSLEDSAVRRALVLWNPGGRDHWDTTTTLTTAVQMMRPGESVITHRHAHSAMRFITHGKGATTTVNGQKITLAEGDLVLTPNWCWHDHANESAGDIVWMDGLDRPLLKLLDAIYFEIYPGRGYQPAHSHDDGTASRYSSHAQRPRSETTHSPFSPQLAYRWRETWASLRHLEKVGEASPFDDVIFTFRNPSTGGQVTPTIGCAIQMLRPGVRTKAHRHSSSAVYQVFRGRGYSVIDGQKFEWNEGDYLALPPRVMHEHANASESEPAVLFSLTDIPLLDHLALYREAPHPGDGYQELRAG